MNATPVIVFGATWLLGMLAATIYLTRTAL